MLVSVASQERFALVPEPQLAQINQLLAGGRREPTLPAVVATIAVAPGDGWDMELEVRNGTADKPPAIHCQLYRHGYPIGECLYPGPLDDVYPLGEAGALVASAEAPGLARLATALEGEFPCAACEELCAEADDECQLADRCAAWRWYNAT